jgi:hypothetical protein
MTATAWLAGGCHCGAVRFRVLVRTFEALDCNCSMCAKKGFLHYIAPPEDFQLVTGDQAMTTYRFNTGTAKHYFCTTCGIHPFYEPRSHPGSYDVNVRCLDDGAAARFRIVPFDGANWEENVAKIR